MMKKILSALTENGIKKYFVTEKKKLTAELFFIRRKLDLTRGEELCDYTVRVFKDLKKGGEELTGMAEVKVELGETEEQISEKIKNAYEACDYSGNPAFSFADGIKAIKGGARSGLSDMTINEAALKFAEAIYRNDGDETRGFINSAEIFALKTRTHIIGSNGCDVTFTEYSANGEFVAQCKVKNDVEMHHTFAYDDSDFDGLAEKVKDALEMVVYRSVAERVTPKGTRNVILSDKSVETIMEYYSDRASAGMIYAGYSGFRKETDVMEGTTGDRVSMKLVAKEPFSDEGIPMSDRVLLDKGVLKTIQGATRLCSYLGEKPTGNYRAAAVECGATPYAEMKKDGVLQVVSFSDFQMDEMSGYFGGEIRLAFLYEGGKAVPVTGGSVNGNFIELQKNMRLSSEKQKCSTFEGPKHILFENVPVNGE